MADCTVPTRHELRSAHQVARTLHAPITMLTDARESFRGLPSNGLLGTSDFEAGQEVLLGLRLIEADGAALRVTSDIATIAILEEAAAVRLLLVLLFERRPPGWLRSATATGSIKAALIPDRELGAIEDVTRDPALREAILLRAGRRIDVARLAELGAIGEDYIVDCCRAELVELGREDLAAAVARVSQISDQLGYDVIAPTFEGINRCLEVKATRHSKRRAEVYISRTEFEQGLSDPDWALVVVEIDADDSPTLLGWCRAHALESLIPTDQHELGLWVSARLLQIADVLQPGLPPP